MARMGILVEQLDHALEEEASLSNGTSLWGFRVRALSQMRGWSRINETELERKGEMQNRLRRRRKEEREVWG